MWNDSVVTDTGMTILSQWAGGGSTLDITAAKLGGGTVPAVQLVRQTNVTGFKGNADIIQHKDIDGGVQFTIRISPLDTAAVIKQIGIFGRLNDGEEKLIALYQDNDGISVPGSEMPEFAYDFNATIAADRGSDMTVNVDPLAFATKVELAEKVAALKEETDSQFTELRSELSVLQEGSALMDCNDAITSGIYYIIGDYTVNSPKNAGGTLVVYRGEMYIHQVVYIGNTDVFFRRKHISSGVWNDWTGVATKIDITPTSETISASDFATLASGLTWGSYQSIYRIGKTLYAYLEISGSKSTTWITLFTIKSTYRPKYSFMVPYMSGTAGIFSINAQNGTVSANAAFTSGFRFYAVYELA